MGMIPVLKKYGQIILATIGALAIIGTAWWANGTDENNDAWLYVFCIWLILYSALEVYLKKKKDKDQ
jgi:hypothetical protein